jgi:hypothetical protein
MRPFDKSSGGTQRRIRDAFLVPHPELLSKGRPLGWGLRYIRRNARVRSALASNAKLPDTLTTSAAALVGAAAGCR